MGTRVYVHESKYVGKRVPSSPEFVHDGLLLFQQLGSSLPFFLSSFSGKAPSCLLRTFLYQVAGTIAHRARPEAGTCLSWTFQIPSLGL